VPILKPFLRGLSKDSDWAPEKRFVVYLSAWSLSKLFGMGVIEAARQEFKDISSDAF